MCARKGGVTAPRGFVASSAEAGIKQAGGLDIGLLAADAVCSVAGTFTTNRIRASCVDWSSKRVSSGRGRAVICNSGNANACTGERGRRDTERMAREVAGRLGIEAAEVCVASTGVIGEPLPMGKLVDAVPGLVSRLSLRGGPGFARAIMTTDTVPKESAVKLDFAGATCAIGGAAKGSGMIHPRMATMLAFVTTDVGVAPRPLQRILSRVVERTFNNLTIDGDTSTNDMVLLMANGASGVSLSTPGEHDTFEKSLYRVCNELCAAIAGDGEGATKRIEIEVRGGKSSRDAKRVAQAVANSSLVKTAIFGNDPNWGRILCAIGYAGAPFSRSRLSVSLAGMPVCRGTEPIRFARGKMRRALQRSCVPVSIDLGLGKGSAVAHTCDLSYDYIRINAEYHT